MVLEGVKGTGCQDVKGTPIDNPLDWVSRGQINLFSLRKTNFFQGVLPEP